MRQLRVSFCNKDLLNVQSSIKLRASPRHRQRASICPFLLSAVPCPSSVSVARCWLVHTAKRYPQPPMPCKHHRLTNTDIQQISQAHACGVWLCCLGLSKSLLPTHTTARLSPVDGRRTLPVSVVASPCAPSVSFAGWPMLSSVPRGQCSRKHHLLTNEAGRHTGA